MKVCIINDNILPEKIDSCDIVLLLKNPIPISVKSSPIQSEMWLAKYFINWINNLPCSHCIGSYFEFSDNIYERICKTTKRKFEILQNKEFNIITDEEVIKFWIGNKYNEIPKNCDIVVVDDVPDEKTLTQTRKKTFGNIELATVIKEKLPQIVIYPDSITTNLFDKKNCITKFATVANIIYFNI